MSSCLYFIATAYCFGQGMLLTGTIKNKNGDAITSATVLAKQNSIIKAYDITNELGYFELNLQKQQEYTLEISSVGYTKLIVNYLAINEKESKAFSLLQTEVKEDTVNIVSKRGIYERGDTVFYNTDIFKKNNENNLKDLLSNMPGIRVLPTGKIIIDGEVVNKVLIDGKDLTGENYEKIVNNLSPHNLDQVQVLKKYSDPFELSNSAVGNTELALNLTFKKKGIVPSAKFSVSGGVPIKYYEQKSDFVVITKTITAINFINLNTIGNSALLIASPNSLFSNVDVPLFKKLGRGLDYQNRSNEIFSRVSKNNYSFNNTKYFDNSSQFNIGKKLTNRFSINYAPEKIQQIETSFSKFSLGNQIFSETNSTNNPYNSKKAFSLKNEMIYMIKRNEQLKFKFNLNRETEQSVDMSSVNNSKVFLNNNNKNTFINTLFNYTKFLKRGKILNIATYFDNEKNNEILNNNGIEYTNTIINSSLGKTNELIQLLNTNQLNSGIYVKYIKRKNDYSLTFQPIYKAIKGSLLSNLSATTITNIKYNDIDSFSNNFKYHQSSFSLPITYQVDKKKVFFSITVEPLLVTSQIHKINKTVGDFNSIINLRLQLNKYRNLIFYTTKNIDNTIVNKNFASNIITNNKNKFLPTNFLLQNESYTLTISSYSRGSYSKKPSLGYRLSGNLNQPNFLLNSINNNFYAVQSYINNKVDNKNLSTGIRNILTSELFKTRIENELSVTKSKSNSLQNSILIISTSYQSQLDTKLATKLVGMLNFQINNILTYSKNTSSINNAANQSLNNLLAVDINLNYKKKKHVDIEARNYYFNTFTNTIQNILLFNVSYKQLLNKNKIRFSFDLRNITNKKAFVYQSISINHFYQSNVLLLPFTGLAKFEFLL